MADILFDSRSTQHKIPFGAVSTRQKVSFRILVKKSVRASGVAAFVRRHEHTLRFDFRLNDALGEYEEYLCDFFIEREGTYFYRFEVYVPGGVLFCGRDAEGKLITGDWLPEWQLTVYKNAYTTPDFIKGGLVYHIFCDRFCKAGKIVMPRVGVYKEWTDEVGETDASGVYRANDFYCGNFAGIIEKLDYLASLGVTALYLSPVFKSNSNHRYDTADYSQVEEMLGGERGLEKLIAEAKKKDMAVILDGVFNHTGSDSVYFNKNGRFPGPGAYQGPTSPYYDWYTFESFPDVYNCWWGIGCVPTIARDAVGYQRMIEDKVLKKWTKKGIRGWRLDVVDELSDVFLDDIRSAIKNADDNAVVIGEVWEDASTKVSYGEERRYFQGDQLDGVMNYVYKEAILDYLLHGDGQAFCNKVNDLAENYPGFALDCCLTLIGSHDTVRAINVLSGAARPTDREERRRYRLTHEEYTLGKKRLLAASALQYFLPGVPSLYYGDEVGLQGFEDPFNRRPFPWNDIDDEILTHYKKLGAIRKKYRDEFRGECLASFDGKAVVLSRPSVTLRVYKDGAFEIAES